MGTHDEGMKEVHFYEYCEKCEYNKLQDWEEPCNECLDNPTNLYSHKPVNFKSKEHI